MVPHPLSDRLSISVLGLESERRTCREWETGPASCLGMRSAHPGRELVPPYSAATAYGQSGAKSWRPTVSLHMEVSPLSKPSAKSPGAGEV